MGIDDQGKSSKGNEYSSFLLRLWRVDTEGKRAWRFSLENSVTGERRGFANLGELLAFLLEEICDGQDED
jgi:HD-like signal output (HDOD) protein